MKSIAVSFFLSQNNSFSLQFSELFFKYQSPLALLFQLFQDLWIFLHILLVLDTKLLDLTLNIFHHIRCLDRFNRRLLDFVTMKLDNLIHVFNKLFISRNIVTDKLIMILEVVKGILKSLKIFVLLVFFLGRLWPNFSLRIIAILFFLFHELGWIHFTMYFIFPK